MQRAVGGALVRTGKAPPLVRPTTSRPLAAEFAAAFPSGAGESLCARADGHV